MPSRATTYAVGHGRPPHTPPKLTAAQQAAALAAVREGHSYREVARQFGVSYQIIYRLVLQERRRDDP
jgi:transposase